MAKPPGWMQVSRLRVEGDQVVADVGIRWWHPGAWWQVLKAALCLW
jgi:hypothetical protein